MSDIQVKLKEKKITALYHTLKLKKKLEIWKQEDFIRKEQNKQIKKLFIYNMEKGIGNKHKNKSRFKKCLATENFRTPAVNKTHFKKQWNNSDCRHLLCYNLPF